MLDKDIEVRIIQLNNPKERVLIEEFLIQQDLNLEKDVDYTVALYDNEEIIGTGSLSGKVLKCIAIDPIYRGEGIANRIVSLLISEQYHRGNTHLFIYTKPSNRKMFTDMGFYEITYVEGDVVLLENDPQGIKRFLQNLNDSKVEGKVISSIVMNCNPFTLGHRYLIEEASRNSDIVHIFIVWEDKSVFPPEVRLQLVKEGTAHLSNVVIHPAKDYIISNSTFPSYFIKEKGKVVQTHAKLDLKIFGSHIAPALGINRRYIGEEPYCLVTKEYNEVMKSVLPGFGIQVIEIPRLMVNKTAISASKVRALLKDNDVEELKHIVPSTTYDYLIGHEGRNVIEKIKKGNSRH